MNENALERLRQKTRDKGVERKIEAFRREQIEKEKEEQVQLIGAIYVELFTSCTPIAKKIIIFEQE